MSTRRIRADARRNRERLLAEADATFREHGAGASLESVARRAGVAIGTLYGHFPTRRALVAALLQDRHDALFAAGEDLAVRPDPGEAMAGWVHAVVEHAATYGGLADLLAGGLDDAESELHAACLRITELGERLVARAQAAGAIRSDVRGDDVFALMNAGAWVRENVSAVQAQRLVAFTLAGFAPGDVAPPFRSGDRDTTTSRRTAARAGPESS